MEEEYPERKLAVILHADVVGSTALVQKNETLAHQRIKETFAQFSITIDEHKGTTREIRGDALVAEFERASDAVAAAIAFQSSNREQGGQTKRDIHPLLRVGISLGEVIIADGTVTGVGVIIAQRLEQLAEGGGIVVQGTVADTVPDRLPFDFQGLGEFKLKGFEKPVKAFNVNSRENDALASLESTDLSFDADTVNVNHHKRTSIAVLPFANMSNDPEQEFFGDGIAEEIITQLSKLSALIVIARTSSFAYRDKNEDIRQIGKELDATHVLEGSVRKSGNRIRITAQLIDAANGQHVWADRYDRELVDIFQVQDDIMREIVSALDVEILAGEQARFWSDGTRNLQAWESFRQARDLFSQYRSENHPEGIRLLKSALKSDPEYSAAWHLLANVYFHITDDTRYSNTEREEALKLSRESLEKGLECDPSNPNAWSLRALHYLHDRDFEKAVSNTNKAVSIAPNHAIVLASSAVILTKSGQPELALQRIRRAMQMCPIVPVWFYVHWGQPCRILGKLDEAIEAYSRMVRQDPDQIEGHLGLTGIFAESGDMIKAKSHAAEVLRINPSFSISRYFSNIVFRDQAIVDRFTRELTNAGLPD